MSSFFLKGKPKPNKKRKFPNDKKPSSNKQVVEKSAKEDDNEEISSDEEEDIEHSESAQNFQFSDEEDNETPQDKRLKLAKKYLEEIEKEERSRADDKDVRRGITKRLADEYLDSVGKLRRTVADELAGYDDSCVTVLKHKLQKVPITCVCLSADGSFMFSGSKSQFVVKWNVQDLKPVGFFDCLKVPSTNEGSSKKHRPQIWAMALSTDFKFLAIADMSKSIHIWCPKDLIHLHTLTGHRDNVTALVFRKDSHQLFSASNDRSVKVWSVDEMAYIESLFGHQSPVTGIDASIRERAITSGGRDCTIRIWKITEESQLIYNGHKGSIENVKLINEEHFLSSGDDGSLCIWSGMKKKPLCVKELAHGKAENGDANWISSIATMFNTDVIASASVAGSCDGMIKLWKLGDHYRTITLLFEVPIKGFVNSLAFTSNGDKLIAGVGQEHRLGRWWRMKEGANRILVISLNKKAVE